MIPPATSPAAPLVLFLGGARSGKSRLAQERAARARNVVFVATAEPGDAEMARRIERHRAERPAHWRTIEAPRDLHSAFVRARVGDTQAVLLDCLTLWLSNTLLSRWESGWNEAAERDVLALLATALDAASASPCELLVVSNEVGLGLVPDHPMGRAFRDLAGRANQIVAARASEVYWVAGGLALRMK